jgi:CheY-like chemotaxis protein
MGGAGRAARVVVVDDKRDSATTVGAVLGAAGFEAASTADTTSAIESVLHEGVDVVLAAHSSGGATRSAEVVREIRTRAEPLVRDVSVVVLVDDAGGADAALAAGADSVLIRPVEADRIVEAVTEVAATAPSVRAARRRSR